MKRYEEPQMLVIELTSEEVLLDGSIITPSEGGVEIGKIPLF